MRIRFAVFPLLIFLAANFPVSARKNPPRPFFLETPITMNGAEIPHGMYELNVENDRSSVRVTFWRDGQFIATAQGTWVKSGVKFTENAVLLRVNSDGTRTLLEIRLAGAAKTIVLSNPEPVVRVTSK